MNLVENSPFNRKIYNAVSLARPNDNVIISPFSIAASIAMLRVGAQGKTADEIDQGLELGVKNATEIGKMFSKHLDYFRNVSYINIANRIYVMSGYQVQKDFNEIVAKHFYSDAEEVDFKENVATAKSINNWVETKTNKRIQNLITPELLNDNTRLMLVNAIHFKSKWSKEFKMEDTRNDKFYLNENDHVTVPMMCVTDDFQYGEIPELDATTAELQYLDEECSMLIILPNSRTGLKTLEKKLQDIQLDEIISKMYSESVLIKLPRFTAKFAIDLTEPLQKLGMTTMFTGEADFSKMLESREPLHVSNIIHKAFIDVEEQGTEAAAATDCLLVMKSCRIYSKCFTVDRPFLYIIKKGKIPLFAEWHKVEIAGKSYCEDYRSGRLENNA